MKDQRPQASGKHGCWPESPQDTRLSQAQARLALAASVG